MRFFFKNEAFSLQKLKHFFVHLLWSETELFFVDDPTTLMHFIDCMRAN